MDTNGKTIGEMAVSIPNAIRVFERHKIDYCCHGNRSVGEACAAAGVTVSELLEEIGGTRNTDETRDWSKQPLIALQTFIVDTHHVYTRETLETARLLADKVASRHGAHHPETETVRTLVEQLYNDLFPHMMKEEQVLFPYIAQLETNPGGPPPFFGSVERPIRMMMMEHEAAAEILAALRVATNEYALPEDACISFRALYEQLSALEQDLHRHIHLENNVLFPRAAAMETEARNVICTY
jgi:regulator of cell morphogenesis and NO signaling